MLLIFLCQISTLSTSLELHPIVMVLVIISWRRDDTYRSIILKYSFCVAHKSLSSFFLTIFRFHLSYRFALRDGERRNKTKQSGGLVADRGIDARGIFWQLTFFWGTPHWVRDQVVSWQLPEKLVHILHPWKLLVPLEEKRNFDTYALFWHH